MLRAVIGAAITAIIVVIVVALVSWGVSAGISYVFGYTPGAWRTFIALVLLGFGLQFIFANIRAGFGGNGGGKR